MKPTVLSLFAGLGGGTLGFLRAGFGSVGSLDVDPAAIRDLGTITQGAGCGEVADLATLQPHELRAIVARNGSLAAPDVVFTSPPCKAFSGCLPLETSRTGKYRALSSLAQRGVMIALEAWETPPKLILLENVPRILSRGREWLDQTCAMLGAYGYAVRESTHDCGELGGLGQSRRRFLLVARHRQQAPEYLYEPLHLPLRGVGEVIGQLPVPAPGSDAGGPMHTLPRLSGLNWLRLALIRAGKDWRDLPAEVALRHRAARQNGGYGVEPWDAASHAVVGHSQVGVSWSSVADPRLTCEPRAGVYGALDPASPCGTVTGAARVDNGTYAVCGLHATQATHRIEEGALVGPRVDLDARQYLVIRAADGTWHRPLTTLELAALQGLPTQIGGQWLQLDGASHRQWRMRIGNAVPPPAAEAIARECLRTLQAAAEGRFLWGGTTPVWVDRASAEGENVTDQSI